MAGICPFSSYLGDFYLIFILLINNRRCLKKMFRRLVVGGSVLATTGGLYLYNANDKEVKSLQPICGDVRFQKGTFGATKIEPVWYWNPNWDGYDINYSLLMYMT
jgi:hypothetical protein